MRDRISGTGGTYRLQLRGQHRIYTSFPLRLRVASKEPKQHDIDAEARNGQYMV